MDMALYKKLVDECVELGIEHVRMHNYGEPFVDRQLVEKVRYAKQRGIPQVGMISNGSLITEAAARGMIEAGLDAINISVDASGKETFESTRLGLKYDKVIANVERLLALREAAGTRRPKLILSFVRQNNSDDEHAFIEHWRKRADKIHITDLHNWAGTLNQKSDVNYPCYRPWLTFTALWDGRVSLCCADFDGRTILGDLRTSTIPRSGTPSATAPCAGSTWKAAGPTSAGRAICRRRTRRSGLQSSGRAGVSVAGGRRARRAWGIFTHPRSSKAMKHLRVALLVAAVCMPASAVGGRTRAVVQGRPRHAESHRCLAATDPERMGAAGADAHHRPRETHRQPAHARTRRRSRETGARDPAPIGGRLHRRAARRDGLSVGCRASTGSRCCRPASPRRRPWGRHGPQRLSPPPPTPFPDPTQLANEEPDQRLAEPSGGPDASVQTPSPRTRHGPGGPGGPMPAPLRGPVADDPNAQAPSRRAPGRRLAPLVTARPGVIPAAANAAAPVGGGSVYSPPHDALAGMACAWPGTDDVCHSARRDSEHPAAVGADLVSPVISRGVAGHARHGQRRGVRVPRGDRGARRPALATAGAVRHLRWRWPFRSFTSARWSSPSRHSPRRDSRSSSPWRSSSSCWASRSSCRASRSRSR